MLRLLRFATAGSVDDGKSTLIGRLLHDTKSLFDDQHQNLQRLSEQRGAEELELALLTDGLRAEREQGITIDVAYRYFATPIRRFVIADTPGHVEYTRNMVTGASTSDVALVLVDARKGIVEQSRRHLAISSLLQVPDIILCVNKMDLVDWSQDIYESIVNDAQQIATQLGRSHLLAVPVSALHGDNVVDISTNTSWYDGPSLLQLLETVDVEKDSPPTAPRFPVQYVIRPPQTDYRGYAGRISGGSFNVGDTITVHPSGRQSRIAAIETFDGSFDEAHHGQSVTIRLEDEIDVGRGDVLTTEASPPTVTSEIKADLCWMSSTNSLRSGQRLKLKTGTTLTNAIVTDLHSRLNIDSLTPEPLEQQELSLNEIAFVSIKTAQPISIDTYQTNRHTGSFILIDTAGGETVGAGMITAH